MEKKLQKNLITMFSLLAFFGGITLGEGCFHDAIEVTDEPGVVIQGARIRNVACMPGSEVMATLKAGTKVRIIGKTAWTKIVMPDGKIGRIGNSYIKSSESRASVPSAPKNHVVADYCDTTNITRCPYPSAVGAIPTFYTKSVESQKDQSESEENTQANTQANPALDALLNEFYANLDDKYSDDDAKKTQIIMGVISALKSLKSRNAKLGSAIDYLIADMKQRI